MTHAPSGEDTRRAQPRRRPRLRRPMMLTFLGTVFPGGGLSMTRWGKAGVALLAITVIAAVGALVYVMTQDVPSLAVTAGTDPQTVQWLFYGVLVAAGVWVLSVVATAVVARPRGLPAAKTVVLALFTATMCAALAVPANYVLTRLDSHRKVLDTSFTGARPGSQASSTNTPTVNAPDPWAGTTRVNLLLLGSDAGPDRVGVRTDSMIVASIDPATGNTILIGIPRNLQRVPIPTRSPLHRWWPEGYNCGSECLMNAIWTEAENRARQDPAAFGGDPQPGLTATRDAISEVLGISIDNTLVIDLAGFEGLVDAFGGVDITVRSRTPIGRITVDDSGRVLSAEQWLEPGLQHLTGWQALQFSRTRKADNDYQRMRRQRCMVGALIQQADAATVLNRYNELATVFAEHVAFDIRPEQLPAWVTLAQRMRGAEITVLTMTGDVINTSRPDYPFIRAVVEASIRTGDPQAGVREVLGTLAPTAASPTAGMTLPPDITLPPGMTLPPGVTAPPEATPSPTTPVAPEDLDLGGSLSQAC